MFLTTGKTFRKKLGYLRRRARARHRRNVMRQSFRSIRIPPFIAQI